MLRVAFSQDKRLEDDQVNPMKAFKAARYFSPSKINEMQPTANGIDDLQAFLFLASCISGSKAEVPCYLAVLQMSVRVWIH